MLFRLIRKRGSCHLQISIPLGQGVREILLTLVFERLRPVLGRVTDAHDFEGLLFDPINDNIGQRREHQFASAFHSAISPAIGEISQTSDSIVEGFCDSASCGWVVLKDILNDAFEIICSFNRPANLHQD